MKMPIAEIWRIEVLLPLFEKYGIPPPLEPDPDRITAPDSLLEACRAAIAAEVANVALYDVDVSDSTKTPRKRASYHPATTASNKDVSPAREDPSCARRR